MKRQELIITLNQLYKLTQELENEFDDGSPMYETDDDKKFQINIINKSPECSDTWEIESHSTQYPTVSGLKKEGGHAPLVRNQPHHIVEMEQLDEDGSSLIDALTNPLPSNGDEVSRIDGRRLNLFKKASKVVMKEYKKLLEELGKK